VVNFLAAAAAEKGPLAVGVVDRRERRCRVSQAAGRRDAAEASRLEGAELQRLYVLFLAGPAPAPWAETFLDVVARGGGGGGARRVLEN
jgi:hypothetical protein